MSLSRMSLWLTTAAVVGLASAELAYGQRPGPQGGRERGGPPSPGMMLERLDKNRDGKLTEGEVPEPMWARLSHADKNEDGAVTKEEVVQGMRRRLQSRGANEEPDMRRPGTPGRGGPPRMGPPGRPGQRPAIAGRGRSTQGDRGKGRFGQGPGTARAGGPPWAHGSRRGGPQRGGPPWAGAGSSFHGPGKPPWVRGGRMPSFRGPAGMRGRGSFGNAARMRGTGRGPMMRGRGFQGPPRRGPMRPGFRSHRAEMEHDASPVGPEVASTNTWEPLPDSPGETAVRDLTSVTTE